MKAPILALSLLALAAAQPLHAQVTPFSFRDRTLVGAGIDLIGDGDFSIPMAGFHMTRLSGRWIAPAVDAAVFWLPGAGFAAMDVGVGAAFPSPDGRAALLLRGGPSVLGGFLGGEGGVLAGGHLGAAVVLRLGESVGLRLDATQRLYHNPGGALARVWGFGMGFTGLGRSVARPARAPLPPAPVVFARPATPITRDTTPAIRFPKTYWLEGAGLGALVMGANLSLGLGAWCRQESGSGCLASYVSGAVTGAMAGFGVGALAGSLIPKRHRIDP